jgi:hypothetical protein
LDQTILKDSLPEIVLEIEEVAFVSPVIKELCLNYCQKYVSLFDILRSEKTIFSG